MDKYAQLNRVATIMGTVKEAGAVGEFAKLLGGTGKALAGPGSTLGGLAFRYAPHALLGYGAYKGYQGAKGKINEVRASRARRKLMAAQRQRLIQAARGV